LLPVAQSAALEVVEPLLTGDLGHLSGQELGEHVEAHVDRRRQKSVAHVGGEDLELAFYLLDEGLRQPSALEVDEPETRHKAQFRARGGLRV